MALQMEQPVQITLTARQWNDVLNVLAAGSYSVVAPLIETIRQQCMAADPETQQQQQPLKLGNGLDPHVQD